MHKLYITLLFFAGYAGFIKALWGAMQPEGAFDLLSGGRWGKWINKQHNAAVLGSRGAAFIDKVFGGCEQCGSWWWVVPFLYPYYYFCGWWVILYWFIASLGGYFVLTYKRHV